MRSITANKSLQVEKISDPLPHRDEIPPVPQVVRNHAVDCYAEKGP